MRDRVVLRSSFGKEFVLMPWVSASRLQRACALERHEAGPLFDRLVDRDQQSFEFHRPCLLALTGMYSPLGTGRILDMARRMVREDLSRVGRLILVSDCLHLPPCGVGRKPDSLEGTAGSTGSSQWVGDSSKWSQEKKILSMHPDLRPLVEEVIHGMTRRGFQPTIFFGWRSVAVQLEIFKKKHTRVRFSFHNVQKKDGIPDAYVADIVDRRWAWSDAARIHGYWNAPGEEARKQKLYWGGDWDRPDWAHVQLVPNSQLRRLKRESGL